MAKPVVGIFDLTDCEGCEVEIVNSPYLVQVLTGVDIKHFRVGQAKNKFDSFDVSFIEGACLKTDEIEFVKEIRAKSKIVVALGTCACFGGIAGLDNHLNVKEAKKLVYGDKADFFEMVEVKPLSEHIKVDFMVRGCPIVKEDFEMLVSDLLAGRIPREHSRPVCIDCKTRETPCVLLKKQPCAGPVTYGGCKAPCPASGMYCDGCRGALEIPEMSNELELLKKIASADDITRLFRKWAITSPYFRDVGGEKK